MLRGWQQAMQRMQFLSRPERTRMLAGRRSIKLNGVETERTPLLVPSFSSKGFPEVADIIKMAEEFIEGPMLVSAYDLHYKHIRGPFVAPSLLFLDSGGYHRTPSSGTASGRHN